MRRVVRESYPLPMARPPMTKSLGAGLACAARDVAIALLCCLVIAGGCALVWEARWARNASCTRLMGWWNETEDRCYFGAEQCVGDERQWRIMDGGVGGHGCYIEASLRIGFGLAGPLVPSADGGR